MSRRGRPRYATPSIHFAIAGWLHPEFDADILAWLNAIPKGERINALKTALRSGGLKVDTGINNSEPDQVQSTVEELLGHWEY